MSFENVEITPDFRRWLGSGKQSGRIGDTLVFRMEPVGLPSWAEGVQAIFARKLWHGEDAFEVFPKEDSPVAYYDARDGRVCFAITYLSECEELVIDSSSHGRIQADSMRMQESFAFLERCSSAVYDVVFGPGAEISRVKNPGYFNASRDRLVKAYLETGSLGFQVTEHPCDMSLVLAFADFDKAVDYTVSRWLEENHGGIEKMRESYEAWNAVKAEYAEKIEDDERVKMFFAIKSSAAKKVWLVFESDGKEVSVQVDGHGLLEALSDSCQSHEEDVLEVPYGINDVPPSVLSPSDGSPYSRYFDMSKFQGVKFRGKWIYTR